jgi:RNA recognition motif-containing protein
LAARKLFVRQLSFDTTELTLQSFFAQYGELQEVFLFREMARAAQELIKICR